MLIYACAQAIVGCFLNSRSWGMESKLGPLGTSAIYWPIAPAPGNCGDGEFCGMKIGRGTRSTRRKPAPAPVLSTTNPTALGSQRLTA
jgi:hypothetical protein